MTEQNPTPRQPRGTRATTKTPDFLSEARKLVERAEAEKQSQQSAAKSQDKALKQADENEEIVLQAAGLQVMKIEEERQRAREAKAAALAKQQEIDDALKLVAKAVKSDEDDEPDEDDSEPEPDDKSDAEKESDQRAPEPAPKADEKVSVKDDNPRPAQAEQEEAPTHETRVVDHDEPLALPPGSAEEPSDDREPPIWKRYEERAYDKPAPRRSRRTDWRVTSSNRGIVLAIVVAVVVFILCLWVLMPFIADIAGGHGNFADNGRFQFLVSFVAAICFGLLVYRGDKSTTTVHERA